MKLSPEQRADLIEKLAQAEDRACCSDNAAGITKGVSLALRAIGIEYDQRALGDEVVARVNELYCEAKGLVECKLCRQLVPAETSHLHQDEFVCELCWDERLRTTE